MGEKRAVPIEKPAKVEGVEEVRLGVHVFLFLISGAGRVWSRSFQGQMSLSGSLPCCPSLAV